jgi:hypothetical protein
LTASRKCQHSGSPSAEPELWRRIADTHNVVVRAAQGIFQAAIVDSSERDLIGQPFILRMILQIEPYRRGAVGLDSEDADDLVCLLACRTGFTEAGRPTGSP